MKGSTDCVGLATAALALALLAAVPAWAETMSLNEALATAYQTNPQLDAERAQLRATDEGVAQANAGWKPSISLQGSFGTEQETRNSVLQVVDGQLKKVTPQIPTHPLTGQLTISQPIFRGGQTWAEVGRAKAQVGVERAQLFLTEENVLLDAATAYMDVVRDTQSVLLREQNVAALQQQLKDTQTEASVGEQTKTDVAQAQARLAGAQSDLASARAQLGISRSHFEQVIGRESETLERLPRLPSLPPSLNEALQIAEVRNPNMIGARDNEKATQYQVDDAIGALMPQAQVQAFYEYGKDSLNLAGAGQTARIGAVIGQVTIPIYQGGGDEATVRRAKELHSAAMIQIAQADREVRNSVQSAWQSFTAAKAAIATDEAAVAANQQAYLGVREQWKLGDRTTLDVLNAEQELFSSQLSLVDAQHDMVVAAFQLLLATGQLTARDLGLRVNLYDPLEHYNEDAGAWFGFGN